ncbi:MAG: Ig-like domain-containing protein [Dehalococcoidales bacterium]|nr:Ig-like domain-containing protein [Dehalococcoidales bacterium]
MMRAVMNGTLATLLVMSSAGCAPSLKSIVTKPKSGTILISSIQQIVVTATDTKDNGKDVTGVSTYKSSDDKIVTVSANGSVEGKSAGWADITVSYSEGKVTKISTVNVNVVFSRGEGQSLCW